MNDALSDDAYWRPSRAASIAFSQWKINSSDGTANNYWNMAFQSINAANFAIKNIPGLLEKGLTQARLIRTLRGPFYARICLYVSDKLFR